MRTKKSAARSHLRFTPACGPTVPSPAAMHTIVDQLCIYDPKPELRSAEPPVEPARAQARRVNF
ncbi:MAG: hypothetical protein IPI16_01640 [Comamonadaceae bacterium]|nr:hypothetical protein [Comamonadaceae bacterium]